MKDPSAPHHSQARGGTLQRGRWPRSRARSAACSSGPKPCSVSHPSGPPCRSSRISSSRRMVSARGVWLATSRLVMSSAYVGEARSLATSASITSAVIA